MHAEAYVMPSQNHVSYIFVAFKMKIVLMLLDSVALYSMKSNR